MTAIKSIKQIASKHFTSVDRREVDDQTSFYNGEARSIIKAYLDKLKVRLPEDDFPLQGGLLDYVIGQVSVVYRTPPTRFLRRQGRRVGDNDFAQMILWDLYDLSEIDAEMKHLDLMRSLWRTAFVVLYPSEEGRVILRTYPPTQVYRDPNLGEPDNLNLDKRIMIERSDETYEIYTPTGDGKWQMQICDENGIPTEDTVWTYDVLPIVAFYDGKPTSPYLSPYQWRSEYMRKIAQAYSELFLSVYYDVHPRATLETTGGTNFDEAGNARIPNLTLGPNKVAVLDKDQRLVIHQVSPKIMEIGNAVNFIREEWFRAESLPPDQFRQSQSVSALGLRVLSQPLQEKREKMIPFTKTAERRLFNAYRALHNQYAPQWGQPWIDDSANIEIVIGDVDVPTDPTNLANQIATDLNLGLISRVDAMMLRHNISRKEAIAKLEQVQQDATDYPIVERPDRAITGTKPADPTGETTEASDSSVGAAREQLEADQNLSLQSDSD